MTIFTIFNKNYNEIKKKIKNLREIPKIWKMIAMKKGKAFNGNIFSINLSVKPAKTDKNEEIIVRELNV